MSLAAQFRILATRARSGVISRLRRGRDLNGASLPPKEERGPPGVSSERRGGLFPLLSAGRIQALRDGYRVTFAEPVGSFHRGDINAPRRIVGLDRALRAGHKLTLRRALVRKGKRLGIGRRS